MKELLKYAYTFAKVIIKIKVAVFTAHGIYWLGEEQTTNTTLKSESSSTDLDLDLDFVVTR